MYLQDLKAGTPPVESPAGKISSTAARFSTARFTSPPMKMRHAIACSWRMRRIPSARTGKRSFRRSRRRVAGVQRPRQETVCAVRAECHVAAEAFRSRRARNSRTLQLPAIGTSRDRRQVGQERSFSSASSHSPCRRRSIAMTWTDSGSSLWAKVDAPSIDPSATRSSRSGITSKDGTEVPMFVVHKKGLEQNGKNPTCSPATAASTSA